MRRRTVFMTAVAVCGLGATAVGLAVAASGLIAPAADGKIYVCYGSQSGLMRLVAKSASCRKGERRLAWNQTGRRGDDGKDGKAGAQGAAGPAGPIAGTPAGGDLTGTYPNPRLAASEALHVVGTPGAAPYTSSFRAYQQPTYADLAYYRDAQGVVHLSGLTCRNSAGNCQAGTLIGGTVPIFILPEGYRPAQQHIFTAISFSSLAGGTYYNPRIDVLADGTVEVTAPPNAGSDWMSLDGIDFRAG